MSAIPWSYSSLTSFETCPRRHKIIKIDKAITEPPSEAMTHGNAVHKALELAFAGTQALPDKYKQYGPVIEKLRAKPGKRLIEYKFGLTKNLAATDFFANDVWVRGVIDAGLVTPKVAVLLDHKTGKPKPDADQLKLFAGVAFAEFPYLEKVNTGYLWLAYNKVDSQEFTKADVPGIWQEFLPRVSRLERAEKTGEYPPNPSGLCRAWCPVGRSRCEFCGID